MSLRSRLLGLSAIVMGLCLAANLVMQRWVILPTFDRLEAESAARNLRRCVDAFTQSAAAIAAVTGDYGAWDDTAAFIADGNDKFIHDNLNDSIFSTLDVDLIGYYRADGSAAWVKAFDRDNQTPIELAQFGQEGLDPAHPLIAHKQADSTFTTLIMTEAGPMLVASSPITNTNHELPIRGALVMGRLLSPQVIERFEKVTAVSMQIEPLAGAKLVDDQHTAMKALLDGAEQYLSPRGERIDAYALLRDVEDRPAVLLRATMPRAIMAAGRGATWTANWVAIAATVVILAVLWLALGLGVVRPLTMLTRHVVRVGSSDDLSQQIDLNRRDELGRLAQEFNRMAQSLADSRRRLADHAHEAGMAEIATEVLHNVSNAMNTIGVSAELVEEKLRQPPPGLKQTVSVLEENRGTLAQFLATEGRGARLVDFLAVASRVIEQTQTQTLDEVTQLKSRVAEIKAIIATQQYYARRVALHQDESLARIIDDALRIAGPVQLKKLTIQRQFEDVPPLPIERTKVLQVLTNLIGNALDAMQATPDHPHKLTLGLRRDDRGHVMISVTDTGVGIDAAHSSRLFEYGFTTKSGGNGYGLHYCFNTIRAMGGQIHCNSDGAMKGATFTVTLPILQEAGRTA